MARGLRDDHMLNLLAGMNPNRLTPADLGLIDSFMAESGRAIAELKEGDTKPPQLNDPAVMYLYVIYYNPSDFPGRYVCRVNHVGHTNVPGRLIANEETLQAVRDKIPPGMHCIPRSRGDDKVIVETWL